MKGSDLATWLAIPLIAASGCSGIINIGLGGPSEKEYLPAKTAARYKATAKDLFKAGNYEMAFELYFELKDCENAEKALNAYLEEEGGTPTWAWMSRRFGKLCEK